LVVRQFLSLLVRGRSNAINIEVIPGHLCQALMMSGVPNLAEAKVIF
jgi:hypothetical protein